MGCVVGTLDLPERGERGGDGDEKRRKREGMKEWRGYCMEGLCIE